MESAKKYHVNWVLSENGTEFGFAFETSTKDGGKLGAEGRKVITEEFFGKYKLALDSVNFRDEFDKVVKGRQISCKQFQEKFLLLEREKHNNAPKFTC